MYFLYVTRPDISFAVKQLSKYNINTWIKQIKGAKKIVNYLIGTIYLSFIYNSHLKNKRETKVPITLFAFGLIRYGESSYDKNLEDKKSVIGSCYLINGVVISWCSKKQKTVSTLITEVK